MRLPAVLVLVMLAAGCAGGAQQQLADGRKTIGLEGTLRLADAAFSGGDIDGAIRLYDQAVRRFPQAPRARAALADALLAAGAHPEAETAYRRLIQLDAEQPAGLVGLGRVALADGRPSDAMRYFSDGLRSFPDDTNLMNGLAVAYDYVGRHQDAQNLYRRILDRQPANRAVANNYALSLLLSGQRHDALDRLTRLAAGPTLLPQARFNLALAYGLDGDEDAARSLLQEELGRTATEDTLAFYRALARHRGPRG